jgi:putative aldouronate transport system substrate-binding protein
MKSTKVRLLSLVAATSMLLTVFTGCSSKKEEAPANSEGVKEAEITMLFAWNGGAGQVPEDQVNNPVAKKIKEKTGVTMKIQTITTSETEKLNMMFASGDIPDLVNAPYWGTTGGEGLAIKKAAVEGLIMPLNDLVGKYPNVQRMMNEGIAKDFKEFDLEPKEFNGNKYIIPQQTPRSDADIISWAYNVWARKDILDALKVNPADIDSSEKLYELMKKVKDGGFKDSNGKPVITAGAWGNGWDYGSFLTSFTRQSISGFKNVDGKLVSWEFDPLEDQKALYMRKLVAEGLFDPEAFTQTDTVAKEKMATGRVAIFGGHYPALRDFMSSTLYKSNPEMKFVAVGPLKDADGKGRVQIEKKGRGGFPAMFIGKNSKNADAVLKVIDYINSDEGLLLATYGIEGTHYTMVDGKPKYTDEWSGKKKDDNKAFVNEGLVFYTNLIGADPRNSMWPEESDPDYEAAKAATPLLIVDKVSANYLTRSYPKLQDFRDKTAGFDWNKEFQKAVFAKSDDEALKILNDYREKLKGAGIEEYVKYVEDEAAKRTDIGF